MAKAVRSQSKSTEKKDHKVSSILITQPRPDTDKSPYFELAKKYDLKLDFHAFIRVEGLSGKDFRKQKVDIAEYSAIIFTSRNAVDHFFRICEELKVKVSQDMKYFCITEAVALYLQKFILYRKRKVFFSPDGTTEGLLEVIGKHKHNEKYIVPTSDSAKNEIPQF
ncbi:MAG: uroporphyrinogen-III synthase, partial [Bacteroidota bacterium]